MINWHVATIGKITRNKYWGELETRSYRSVVATSTVVQTDYGNILVDPSLEGEAMAASVYDCCGLNPKDITIVFITHSHFDHWRGLEAFPNAKIYIPQSELTSIRMITGYMLADKDEKEKFFSKLSAFCPVGEYLVPGVKVVHLPGHTGGLHGLLFTASEGRVLISGDAVMNREYFTARDAYFYGASLADGRESVYRAAELADIIIPGHGNYFLTNAYPASPSTQRYPWEDFKRNPQNPLDLNTKCEIILENPVLFKTLNSLLPEITIQKLAMAYDIPFGAIALSQSLSDDMLRSVFETLNQKLKKSLV